MATRVICDVCDLVIPASEGGHVGHVEVAQPYDGMDAVRINDLCPRCLSFMKIAVLSQVKILREEKK